MEARFHSPSVNRRLPFGFRESTRTQESKATAHTNAMRRGSSSCCSARHTPGAVIQHTYPGLIRATEPLNHRHSRAPRRTQMRGGQIFPAGRTHTTTASQVSNTQTLRRPTCRQPRKIELWLAHREDGAARRTCRPPLSSSVWPFTPAQHLAPLHHSPPSLHYEYGHSSASLTPSTKQFAMRLRPRYS
ncbi:hypothetical protein DFH09DRAFT_1478142 [Mycena vulgaris]|nr:hypothetical protein DFH09DRAFT_1478142 [Mycena vulgaris]